jgi:hypothetical protein
MTHHAVHTDRRQRPNRAEVARRLSDSPPRSGRDARDAFRAVAPSFGRFRAWAAGTTRERDQRTRRRRGLRPVEVPSPAGLTRGAPHVGRATGAISPR